LGAGLIYRSAAGYALLMRGLYGRHYDDRSRVLAALVPPGASVLDLCCGPGFLYERHLRAQRVQYLGLDINARFIARLRALGGTGRVCDLRRPGALPKADVVIMQASLYHFLPDVGPLLARMERAARRRVIIAEPIKNVSSSRNRLLAALARWQTDPGLGTPPGRFDEPMLDRTLGSRPCRARQAFLIPGGREKVYVLDVEGDVDLSACPAAP
jgi:SAM-dependent methyltransferase